jgi:hypothetical protein
MHCASWSSCGGIRLRRIASRAICRSEDPRTQSIRQSRITGFSHVQPPIRPARSLRLVEKHDGNTPPYRGRVLRYYPLNQKPEDALYEAPRRSR